jgi:sugar phosphate isomerase/epimerase
MPNEETKIDVESVHAYGRHRLLFENLVQEKFPGKVSIVRLPGLFGVGLKKNLIYDLLHSNNLDKLPCGSFQWFDMSQLESVLAAVLMNNTQIINVVSEPVSTQSICALFGHSQSGTHSTQYNVGSLFFTPTTKEESLTSIQAYIALHRTLALKKRNRKYKIGVSIIAIPTALSKNRRHFETLCQIYGIDYFEIAPTIFQPSWNQIFAAPQASYHLGYSFQSVTYGLDFNIFLDRDIATAHMTRVIQLAEAQKIKVIVFGCPKNRLVPSSWNLNDAIESAAIFFRLLGDQCTTVAICVENNSCQYGCNFLTTPQETSEFVRLVNHPRIQWMMDVGNAVMEGLSVVDIQECIQKNVDILGHVHVSEPKMRAFDGSSNLISDTLEAIGYDKGVTLEMLPGSPQEFSKALELFVSLY